jgi:hypothetical protein
MPGAAYRLLATFSRRLLPMRMVPARTPFEEESRRVSNRRNFALPAEVLQAREMLNSRYDDLKSGRVKPIPRDEVIAHFREKSDAARRTPLGS